MRWQEPPPWPLSASVSSRQFSAGWEWYCCLSSSVGPPTQLLVLGVYAVFAAVSWLLAAGVSLIIVVPSGFVGGVVVWRFVPEPLRVGGFVGGLLSVLVGYAVSCTLLLPVGVLFGIIDGIVGPSSVSAAESILEFTLLLGGISLYTNWATVPVGVLAGYLYERPPE